ncbi:hypothetical protein [Rubritalea marina]|uniref:hypothetical protein n=1 Tax=Rubritalea marina TaxID=361055 RepID=UPI00037242E7|nr:hypothetical protein [Rubritalea marina]
MKGSPIIATALTIVILLGLYLGMRALILPEGVQPVANSGHGHDHGGHDHGDHGHDHGDAHGHNDTAVESEFEIYFSSMPKRMSISIPSTGKELFNVEEFDSQEWNGSATLNLEAHHIELQVDIEWEQPENMNFAQIVLNPEAHAGKEFTLRSDENISDIAEFEW